jgi:pilus assembly protein Flp/PilA
VNIALVTAYFRARLDSARADENGASAVEYGLLVALIAAVIVTVVFTLGETLQGVFTDVNTSINAPGG